MGKRTPAGQPVFDPAIARLGLWSPWFRFVPFNVLFDLNPTKSPSQIIAYCGTLTRMGLYKPLGYTTKEFFSIDTKLSTTLPYRDFFNLRHALRFGEYDGTPISKVQKIVEEFFKIQMNLLEPGEFISGDEVMIPCCGRTKLMVYIPSKPKSNGLLLRACGGSIEGRTFLISGFLYNPKSGQTTQEMLIEMIKPYENTRRIFFCDKFYTSIDAGLELLKHGVYCHDALKNTTCLNYKI